MSSQPELTGANVACILFAMDEESGICWIGGIEDLSAGPPGILIRDIDVPNREDFPKKILDACLEYENPEMLLVHMLLDGPPIRLSEDLEEDDDTWDITLYTLPMSILQEGSPADVLRINPSLYLEEEEDYTDWEIFSEDVVFVPADLINFASSDDALTLSSFLRFMALFADGDEDEDEDVEE